MTIITTWKGLLQHCETSTQKPYVLEGVDGSEHIHSPLHQYIEIVLKKHNLLFPIFWFGNLGRFLDESTCSQVTCFLKKWPSCFARYWTTSCCDANLWIEIHNPLDSIINRDLPHYQEEFLGRLKVKGSISMCIDTMYGNEQHSDKPLGFGSWWHISYHHHSPLVYLRYGFCVIKTTFPFRRSAKKRTPLELPPFPKNHFQDSSNKWKSSLWMCKSSPIRIHSGRIVLGTVQVFYGSPKRQKMLENLDFLRMNIIFKLQTLCVLMTRIIVKEEECLWHVFNGQVVDTCCFNLSSIQSKLKPCTDFFKSSFFRTQCAPSGGLSCCDQPGWLANLCLMHCTICIQGIAAFFNTDRISSIHK